MLGERQKAALEELAQWWEGIRHGGAGSHAVLLAGPAGWGKSTVVDQLAELISQTPAPASVARISGQSLPDGPARRRRSAAACWEPGCGGRRPGCCAAAG